MNAIKVTFTSRDDVPIGTIELGEDMACLFSINDIDKVCQQFRLIVNGMGEPLDFRIEYIDKDE